MALRRIYLSVQPASGMGRGIINGAVAYAAPLGEWRFTTVDATQLKLGAEINPDAADGVIGTLRPEVAEVWAGPPMRYVVNTSRGQYSSHGSNVTCDDERIGQLAAEHLLAKPVAGFAYFGREDGGRRQEAFIESIRAAGQEVTTIVGQAPDKADAALLAVPRPCGVMAFNDIQAVELIRQAERLGLGVPGDLAVVGADDDEFVTVFSPIPVTSVDPDFRRVGYRAAELLDAIFRGTEPPGEPIRIPPKGVIERDSTDFPGLSDDLAMNAARLIRHQACGGLTVEQIASTLSVTYPTLRRRFLAAFGHSLKDEITRVRLNEAKRLLSETRLPMVELAERLGYADANYFSTVFTKHVGCPPGRYRKQQRSR